MQVPKEGLYLDPQTLRRGWCPVVLGLTGRLTRKHPKWILDAVVWEDGVRVGRHSRQREGHGMQEGKAKNIPGKKTFLTFGSRETRKTGRNEGRSPLGSPSAPGCVCSLLFVVSKGGECSQRWGGVT